MKKRILLVEDHLIVRDGLKYSLEQCNELNFEITDEANNGKEALELLGNNLYDLVITDVSMPEMNGVELTEQIKKQNADQKILALTMLDETQYIKKMVSLDIDGYLLKNSNTPDIIKAINTILSGEKCFPKEVTDVILNDLAGRKRKNSAVSFVTPLTKREKEVLNLIVCEYSNQEIADELFISVRTVDAHKRNIIEKTGARNIAGLVRYAVENDLVYP